MLGPRPGWPESKPHPLAKGLGSYGLPGEKGHNADYG